MVRTYRNNNASSLGGVFESGPLGGAGERAHRARGSVDYDDLLNQKRIEENKYRNSADPFVNGGLKMSSSEGFLNRVNDAPPGNEDFGLASGLNDLSTVLARLQANVDDESGIGSGSMSYPNSANIPNTNMGRKTWSAPQSDPFGFNGVNSVMPPVNMRGGPGEGPTYGRAAKVQAEMAMATGSLGDPLQHLHGQGNGSSPYDGYSPSVYDGQKPTKRGGRESYLKELEMQIAEQKARKQREQANQMDWWEKREEQPFKVNVPQRPHPSQPKPTADQRPDPKNGQKSLQEELRLQMDMKKMREAEERQRELEEEAKLERRIQEQQDRMKREYDEEQNKKKAKEQAKLKRQEEMAKRQKELQKEAEQQRKEVAEKKFQERKAARQRREEQDALERNGDSSDHSTPGPGVRSNSPPLPALRKSGGNSSSDIMEASSSTSVGLSSAGEEDDQDAALGQLTKMREQLEKKKDELDVMDEEPKTPNRGRRRSSIWEGLAEV